MDSAIAFADRCRRLVMWLREPATHLPDRSHGGGSLADHLLTTSALVYCLAYDHPQRDLLRLAALVHDLPPDRRRTELDGVGTIVQPWLDLLTAHGMALDRSEVPTLPTGEGSAERLLSLAHLAASERKPVATAQDFVTHPLYSDMRVDLVYGGATHIKGYVFESARLPEIRGASALLDRVNRLDLPALWGEEPPGAQRMLNAAQRRCYDDVRRWFMATWAQEPLDAPECVLFASGGNILALAPVGWGEALAAAIEQRYTQVTHVAHSVAVAQSFSLLELQYGYAPQTWWSVDDDALRENKDVAWLLNQSQGQESYGSRKGFGELVTVLATRMNTRRAAGSNPMPFVELISHSRKCTSCDVRPAIDEWSADDNTQYFCEACLVKRDAGAEAKRGSFGGSASLGIQSWASWLAERTQVVVEQTTKSLRELSAGAGHVGLIYADGNSVGAKVASLPTIAAYRRFAKQMLDVNEQAVVHALQKHLQPEASGSWPFEIITIGGDDVLMFVPADRALEIAHTLAVDFEQGMYDHGISLSVGVLIMPVHLPVRFARDLVEQLLHSAKGRARGQHDGGTIDFMALKSTPMIAGSIAEYRKVALHRVRERRPNSTEVNPIMSLTQRPYTADELAMLLDAGRALKSAAFPRSQLYQLRSVVDDGELLQSGIDYRYFVERGKRRGEAIDDPYQIFDTQLQRLCSGTAWMPWRAVQRNGTTVYDTPLLDLVEILPFLGDVQETGGVQ